MVTTPEDGAINVRGGTGDKVIGKSMSRRCAVVKAGFFFKKLLSLH